MGDVHCLASGVFVLSVRGGVNSSSAADPSARNPRLWTAYTHYSSPLALWPIASPNLVSSPASSKKNGLSLPTYKDPPLPHPHNDNPPGQHIPAHPLAHK